MQEIEFYCKKCKKSMHMTYTLSGDDNAPVLNRMTLKCCTRKCIRVTTLMNFKEGDLRKKVDRNGRFYL